jgi:hypothetical protein
MFMCLNVDIERQFEFVQGTWLLGASFEGLDAEVDPVLGQRTESDVLTVPTPCGSVTRQRAEGFRDRKRQRLFLPARQKSNSISFSLIEQWRRG